LFLRAKESATAFTKYSRTLEMHSDYQTKIKELERFVVLVRLRYALLTNKGRSRFCARTSMQQRSGVNS
jgi:hypothetical protein